MSRRRQVWIVILAIASLFITVLLLPIALNISTAYLSALPRWVESWVKEHIVWFWIATIISGFLAVISGGISVYLQLTKTSSSLRSDNTLNITTVEVNDAADLATQDPMLKSRSNRFFILGKWKKLAEDLIGAHNDYALLNDKESKRAAVQTLDLLEKLLKHTRRSFIYLNRTSDFVEIARLAYYVAFAHARWKYAADLAYDVGRVYHDHELGKYDKGNTWDWIEALKTCLEKANSARNFDGYWVRAYNEMRPDNPEVLDKPTDIKAQKPFYEALTYAAKLYDLEGLSKRNDEEAKAYFEKALLRADRLPDRVLYSRIKIHIAKLAHRLHIQPVTYYTDALATLDALNLTTLDPLQSSDVVNLKLTCYHHLGSLALPDQGEIWHQKQVELAKEYGSLDFQVSGYMQLAEVALRQGRDQASPNQSQSFQIAYKYVKQAWVINEKFGDEGTGAVEPNKIAQLMVAIVDELIESSVQSTSPASNSSI